MISRFSGLTPTRSRAVAHAGLVFTVAVSPDPDPTYYEQARKALKRIDESLAMSGTDKSRILSAIVYIADIARKKEMNRAIEVGYMRLRSPILHWLNSGKPEFSRTSGWTAPIRRCGLVLASTWNTRIWLRS
jgi:Endoribonuclease L-PSP